MQVNAELQNLMKGLQFTGTSALAAIDRMEEKVLALEAEAEATAQVKCTNVHCTAALQADMINGNICQTAFCLVAMLDGTQIGHISCMLLTVRQASKCIRRSHANVKPAMPECISNLAYAQSHAEVSTY